MRDRSMEIVMMRHGIAIAREHPDCPRDRERALTEKGIRKTEAALCGLSTLGVAPEIIWTSPFVRAVQTAEIAARVLGIGPDEVIETDALLPGSRPRDALNDLRRANRRSILCVGHAPDLDLLVSAMLCGDASPKTHLKKAGAAKVVFPNGFDGAARLDWLIEPRALRLLAAS